MASEPRLMANRPHYVHGQWLSVVMMTLMSLNCLAKVEYQSMDSIVQTAKDFTLANLANADQAQSEITTKIDKRLRLKACSGQLEGFFPEYGRRVGNITVGVRCNGEENWSLFVPVSVKIYRQIVVASRPLARGTVISQADLLIEERNISAFSTDYFGDVDSLIGMQINRPVQLGQSFSSHSVKPRVAIKRGNLVTLIARNAVVEVRMEGKALADGSIGKRLKVKNLRSNRIVEGIVQSENIVVVN